MNDQPEPGERIVMLPEGKGTGEPLTKSDLFSVLNHMRKMEDVGRRTTHDGTRTDGPTRLYVGSVMRAALRANFSDAELAEFGFELMDTDGPGEEPK